MMQRQMSLCFLVSSLQMGCAAEHSSVRTKEPYLADQISVQRGQECMVLWRLVAVQDGVEIPANKRWEIWNEVSTYRGGFESGGLLEPFTAFAFDKVSRQGGWAYALLEPGTYYFGFDSKANGISYLNGLQHFRVDIPRGGSALYLGSVFIESEPESRWPDSRPVLGSFTQLSMTIVDESSLAQEIYDEHAAEYAEFEVSLLQPHEGRIILRTYEP